MKKFISICFLIVLLNSSASGKDNSLTLQTPIAYATGSCIDRCHVNYLSYRTQYKEDIFLHKNHSSLQNIECCECHNNDPVNTKTHGGLIIEENDCKKCHHKEAKNEDCLKCHSEVSDYRNGSFPYADINYTDMKTPDWMYKAVLCTDCHKKEENNFLFQDVRNLCIECHNDDYGLLYDKWQEFLREETQPDIYGYKKSAKMQSYMLQIRQHGIHNIRLSRILLKRIEKEKDNSEKK
ncbi:MAG: hypothetical protein E3K37_04500 [Candidatus Kuenenia sp.]|nr:hypothetical protein [Candidatus Kuenenia hertensis]